MSEKQKILNTLNTILKEFS